MITCQEISEQVLANLKAKKGDKYNKVTPNDIYRIIKYYNKNILKIILSGGFLTLPIYRNHQSTRCIKIQPKMRYLVKREYYFRCARHKIMQSLKK